MLLDVELIVGELQGYNYILYKHINLQLKEIARLLDIELMFGDLLF